MEIAINDIKAGSILVKEMEDLNSRVDFNSTLSYCQSVSYTLMAGFFWKSFPCLKSAIKVS